MPFETPNTDPRTPVSSTPGGWAPLSIPVFRDRFVAATISSVGTWMQDTAGTWLMTVLTSSPLLIALMQTAASLPVLFLGLLAGATADIFDRRKLLLLWQIWMLVSVGVLAALTFAGLTSAWLLLGFTFLLNIGSAMNNPAWQAIIPELVPAELIRDSVTLNAASNNLARAVGPALGGLTVAAFQRVVTGAGTVFLLNAISYAAVIWVLWNWKRTALFRSALPAERIAGSIRSGLRYVRYAPTVRAALIQAFSFTFFVAAIWSLLAVVARNDLHQGALGYGVLNGSLGVGALLAATMLPRIRRHFSQEAIVAASTAWIIAALLILGLVPLPGVVIPSLILSGFAWTSTMSSFNIAVQLAVPPWVQARAMGAYLMCFQGGLALGSVLWGAIAERASTAAAFIVAAAALALSYPFTRRFRLPQGAPPDHRPRPARPAPQPAFEAGVEEDPSRAGPVRVTVDYRVPVENYAAFTHAIHQLRGVRLRDGAVRWGIFRDLTDPEWLSETFIMESWLDYLRGREHVSLEDERIRARALALHSDGGAPPKVTHQIYARETVD
ncbi:MAG TPA: MFS transporter [Terriglobales bacterium]